MGRSGPETLFRRALSKELRTHDIWIVTTHGGPFSAGLPDLIGALGLDKAGRLLGLELKARKVPGGAVGSVNIVRGPNGALRLRTPHAECKPMPTDLQLSVLRDIRDAGGCALVAVKVIGPARDKMFEIWQMVGRDLVPAGLSESIKDLALEIINLGGGA